MHDEHGVTTCAWHVTFHAFGQQKNPPLLLLHGIGIGHRLWTRQIEIFQQSHFVIAPDMAGLTSAACRGGDIHEIAKDVEDELGSRSLKSIAVCGISAGASVALALASRMGPQVNHLIVSAPQARAPRFALRLQITICRLLPPGALVAATKASVRSDPVVAAAAVEDGKDLGKRGLLAALDMLLKVDLRPQLGKIVAPTWVLCGERDRVNLRAARAIAKALPDARLHIEPSVGHLWNVQAPNRFNAVLHHALNSSAG
jgi:3-oxoadipate enol-lactonase